MTVMKNGVATTITCSIAAGVATCTDSTHSASFISGDTIAVQLARPADGKGAWTKTWTFSLGPNFSNTAATVTSPHIVTGKATATTSGVTVTLSSPQAFTSSTSYRCTTTYAESSGNNGIFLSQTSGTSFTITSFGATTDVNYICIGN
jgi:hypothetical protein